MPSTLSGRRVVVTRAAEQADELAALLRRRGAEPVLVPLIDIVEEPSGAAALAALDPVDFDWLVVTSPNGAEHYARAHGSTAPARVAAIGAVTAASLAAAGITVTCVPRRQSAAGLLAEWSRGDSGSNRVLVVQAVDAHPTLADGLRDLGWTVVPVSPYRSVPAQPAADTRQAALSADAVLFASGSAARAWVAVFGTATPPVVVAIGPQTAQAADTAGLKKCLVAADHSLVGMVDVLERHLRPAH